MVHGPEAAMEVEKLPQGLRMAIPGCRVEGF
jgi:hypothetical protein